MQFYECLSLCTALAAVTGVLSPFGKETGISSFRLVYAGIGTVTLGQFSFYFFPEFRCNAAVVFLPAYLICCALDAKVKTASALWRTMFAASLLPLIGTLCQSLLELLRHDYASVDLGTVALRNAMAFFAAAAFLLMRFKIIAKERKQLA